MRLGCIGIGSNAIRLLVASWKDGQLCDVRRERRGTRLFAGLIGGRLTEESIQSSVNAVDELAQCARGDGAQEIFVFATSAVRDAANGRAFTDRCEATCGARVEIVSGEEEAVLSYIGASDGGVCGMIDIDGLTMDEKVLVYADPDLIHQVAYNLLDNAIKFTPAGGTIRFGVERLGPEVEVSIWNSGQGISPEALPYVFQRFYKEDQSRGLHARGAGLGLNICKVLVNLSGGQIRVESKQGEWCRFVFTLPVQPPNPGGMKRLPDESGRPGAVEDPASMKPVD